MIKDWTTYRDMAMDLTKKGFIPVYGDFCSGLEEIVSDCIYYAHQHGQTEVTLLINSDGGNNDCFTAIRGAMIQSGMEFTGLVMSRARSNGFRLLQLCKHRKALSNSQLMFHWGEYCLENNELSAIMQDETWVLKHIKQSRLTILKEVSDRTGVRIEDLIEYALYERDFSADEALEIRFIDEVVKNPPVPIETLALTLDKKECD